MSVFGGTEATAQVSRCRAAGLLPHVRLRALLLRGGHGLDQPRIDTACTLNKCRPGGLRGSCGGVGLAGRVRAHQ